MANTEKLRDFLFRGLLFESEADYFRGAGIRIGADASAIERDLIEETLAPFDVSLRNDALKMTRLYALLFCFENSIRDLVGSRLLENHGDDWWETKVPQNVRKQAESRKETAQKDSWLEGEKRSMIGFTDFAHLSDIIINNWCDFSDLIPSQHWLKQRMDELEKARNFIAHNRLLLPSEFHRIEMYIADWNHVVGL